MTFYYKNKEQLPVELTEENIKEIVNQNGMDVLKGLCVMEIDEDLDVPEAYERYDNVERILQTRESTRGHTEYRVQELGTALGGYGDGDSGLFNLTDKTIRTMEEMIKRGYKFRHTTEISDIAKTIGDTKRQTIEVRELWNILEESLEKYLDIYNAADEEYDGREVRVRIRPEPEEM